MAAKVKNMTAGNPLSLIIAFSLPLMAGNIFQQMYNMVATWVVGRFVSNEAYAAMAKAVNPYGDGQACRRIAHAIRYHFGLTDEVPEDFNG